MYCCCVGQELHLKLISNDLALFKSVTCLLIASSCLKKGLCDSAVLDHGE